MANNRLYIVDTETNERFLLAKSLGTGWFVHKRHHPNQTTVTIKFGESETDFNTDSLDNWLDLRDGEVSYGDVTEMKDKKTKLKLVTENELEFPEEAE